MTLKHALPNQTNAPCLYVVDEAYRLRYFNEQVAARTPEVQTGQHCYAALRGLAAPCPSCPLNSTADEKTFYYDQAGQQWQCAASGKICWPGAGPCHVLVTQPVDAAAQPGSAQAPGTTLGDIYQTADFLTRRRRFCGMPPAATAWWPLTLSILSCLTSGTAGRPATAF